VVWERIKQWPATGVLGVFAVLFLIYFFKTPILEFVDHADVGKIIVNSPTVYTRQRLVNDRLDQAHWLRTQLKSTEVGYDQNFNSIDQVRRTIANTQLKIANAESTDSSEVPAEQLAAPEKPAATEKSIAKKKRAATSIDLAPATATTDSVNVEASTVALFRAKNAYREEVRSEITQTELDDRHDIDGNTIFRLTFDASIIAGTRRDSVAAVGVRLEHDPMSKGPLQKLYLSEYRSLYQDWADYFQRTLRNSLVSIPKLFLTSEPYPPMRLLFSEFLQRRLCQFLTAEDISSILSKVPSECPKGDIQEKATEVLMKFTDQRARVLEGIRGDDFKNQIADLRARNFAFSIEDDVALKKLAINACQAGSLNDRIPISNIFITVPSNTPTREEISCPYYDSLKERLLSGVLLYQKLVSMPVQQRLAWARKLELARSDDPDAGCLKDECNVGLSTLRCFTADFIKANLNAFQDRNAQEQQKIDHFLRLEIVGRGVDDCDILVSGKIRRYPDQAGFDHGLLVEFVKYLNSNTDAFSYSVTPKNLTENISTASDTRDAFTAMLRADSESKEIAGLLKQRSEQNLAIMAHPIVVGLGSGFNISRVKDLEIEAVRSLDFGWIVAPRSLAEHVYEQIDGQYPLTAFISVPSWWSTAHLFINSCWLARSALANAKLDQPVSEICDQDSNAHRSEIIVRLPPAIQEVSRKLAFNVVQQPSLYNPTQKELVIGMPGSLLLEGDRLWRSTEVTAGAQRADRITVLPNMEGILAEFDCVRPPTGSRTIRQGLGVGWDDDQTVTYDSIKVWTSEGVTDSAPVAFVWPPQSNDYLKVNTLCPDNRLKSTAPSADASSKAQQALLRRDESSNKKPTTSAPTSPNVSSTMTVEDPSTKQAVKTPENSSIRSKPP